MTPGVSRWRRSIELRHLSGILGVFEDYYILETGYRKLVHGGYKSEYKLSIPKSQNHNRVNRFKDAINVLSSSIELTIDDEFHVRVYTSRTSCEATPSHPLDVRKEITIDKIDTLNPETYTDNSLSKTHFSLPYSYKAFFFDNVASSKKIINVESYSREIYKSNFYANESRLRSVGSWGMVYFKFIHVAHQT